MSTIRTTSDGYSFHTLELTAHPDSGSFNTSLELLYKDAKKCKDSRRTTYPLKKYGSEPLRTYCSTMLSQYGILLYLTEKLKKDWHKYTIKAIINPRKAVDPGCSYLGIAPADEESLDRFQDAFTALMRKYHLPEFLDEWKLTRLDLCVNLQLNKKKSAREFCRLLQKDLLPPKMERVLFYDPDADKEVQKKQKDADRHSICLKNDSYSIVVYDKLYQAEAERLIGGEAWSELPDSILRLELRCCHVYLKKLAKKEGLDSTSEQLYWMARNSRELILEKVSQAFSGETHYKPDIARKIIGDSDYQETTRKQLQWLISRTRHPFTLQHLEKGMKEKFDLNPRTVAKRLEQLERLGINLVPLRKDFYLVQLPSLPKILELLEDDSVTFQLTSNGEIEW